MELDAYILALVAGMFGIAGTVLGAVLTYRLSLRLVERQFKHLREVSKIDAWHVAAQEFVSAFSREIAILEGGIGVGVDLREMFQRAYDERHAQAIAKFEHFLSHSNKANFRRDWWYHCYGDSDDADTPDLMDREELVKKAGFRFLHYSDEYWLHDTFAPQASALQALRKLASYAKSP